MPYCPECGTQVKESNKFCPSCGSKLEPIQPRQNNTQNNTQPPPPIPISIPTYSEQIKVIIPNLTISKGWRRYDTYNIIVTEKRSIFSKLTNEMMSKTIQKRKAKAGEEGKGFMGKWMAQMKGFNTYTDYYDGMNPEQILSENKDNFAVENIYIRDIKIRDETDYDDGEAGNYTIEIQTSKQKLKYNTQYDPRDLFKNAYNIH